ncbi:Galactosylceramide sulfotransferase [Bulinus truncatus]|nr:Galactosylceramide sulfotransferase [Bulinus truncatus]
MGIRSTVWLFICTAVLFTITSLKVLTVFVQNVYIVHTNNARLMDDTWIIHPPVKLCQPVTNIAFLKTHKTGSTTVSNILLRFGLRHNLNFVLPNTNLYTEDFNYLSKPGEVMNRSFVYPLPEGKEYNILMHHSVYNQTFLRELMPMNTVYISILREPFNQMMSTYEYYKVERHFLAKAPTRFNASNPISSFLENPYLYSQEGTNFTYMRNKQSQDLGFRQEHLEPSKFQEYLKSINETFTLIMILEYFDESLLLLKRQLCWDMKGIIYTPVNENIRKRKWNFTEIDRERHKLFSPIDYTIYSYFLSEFNKKLKNQKEDFDEELAYFRKLLTEVRFNCMLSKAWTVSSTQWHDTFDVTSQMCDQYGLRLRPAVGILYGRVGIPKYKVAGTAVARKGVYTF